MGIFDFFKRFRGAASQNNPTGNDGVSFIKKEALEYIDGKLKELAGSSITNISESEKVKVNNNSTQKIIDTLLTIRKGISAGEKEAFEALSNYVEKIQKRRKKANLKVENTPIASDNKPVNYADSLYFCFYNDITRERLDTVSKVENHRRELYKEAQDKRREFLKDSTQTRRDTKDKSTSTRRDCVEKHKNKLRETTEKKDSTYFQKQRFIDGKNNEWMTGVTQLDSRWQNEQSKIQSQAVSNEDSLQSSDYKRTENFKMELMKASQEMLKDMEAHYADFIATEPNAAEYEGYIEDVKADVLKLATKADKVFSKQAATLKKELNAQWGQQEKSVRESIKQCDLKFGKEYNQLNDQLQKATAIYNSISKTGREL